MRGPDIDPRLLERLEEARVRLTEVDERLADPAVARDPDRLRTLGQERAALEPVVRVGEHLDDLKRELASTLELAEEAEDPEMRTLAEEEAEALERELATTVRRSRELLVPRDPMDDRPAVVEIRAGTGGDEAGLFA
ncbi:MAG TPA: PCRF domain-containing protein, partial [Longimicrobiales bacterium]|nr:PCRF domain-containing protein [Longimicrobiales bacterium]